MVDRRGRVFENKVTLIATVCPHQLDLLQVSQCPSSGVCSPEMSILSLSEDWKI